jgi:two-component system response regulator HydG
MNRHTAAEGRAPGSERRISETMRAAKPHGEGPPVAKGVVLFVDDSPDMLDLYREGMTRRGYQVHTASNADAALAFLAVDPVDAVVTDLKLDGMSGIDLCGRAVQVRPDVPVLLITGSGSMDAAVAAMRAGAYDFITKPAELDALDLALSRAVQHRALREEVKRLRRVVADGDGSRDALGESPEMRSLHALVARVAPVDASVVVTGETGTGKEVVARLLHSQSTRSNGPFVAINCAALPAQLLESELFGHERGAFTDAKARRTGLFVQAHGGTIFLDEIGALPLELQPKLLRALEERVVRPVGGNAEVAFDARLVAATNEDLETAIEAGRFREDLYFRLNVIHIPLPPLRVRGNDVLLLAQQFIDRYASRLGKRVGGLTSAAAEKLLAYAWPGNVRELQNCIERAVALTQYESLTVDDLPEKVRSYESARLVVDLDHPGEFVPMAEIERRYVLRVLAAVSGNKAEAARILGLDRKTLYRKLERYGSGASVSE